MNPNRATKNEVRKQTRAARKWAKRNGGKVAPDAWRLVCPKAAR
jgi:hypothetical protein